MKNYFWIALLSLLPVAAFSQGTGCPSLEAGPAPVFNSGDTTICGSTSLTLSANVFHVGYTNTYTVSSIPYAPPYPFTSGTAIPITTDDIFGPVVTLPFEFCFFGQSYNQLVVGSNGIITFDLSNANMYCIYSYSASLPSTSLYMNAIFGAYHDIYPTIGGAFRYGVVGSYPCRAFIMNFDHIPQYSCNSLISTLQVVLYEGTNAIEVYIQDKPTCSSWNNGNCSIGVQNSTGTVAFVPPGRNTGPWSATNEAWRFTPNGAPAYTVSWFNGSSLLGYTPQVNVNVNQPDTFIAIATYEYCDGTQLIFRDTVKVFMNTQDVLITTPDSVLCLGESTLLTASGADAYVWSDGSTGTTLNVSPTSSGFYYVTGTYLGTCQSVDSIYLTVNPLPSVSASVSPAGICSGDTALVSSAGAISYLWNTTAVDTTVLAVSPATTTSYSVTGTDANGCTSTAQTTLTVYDNPQIQMSASPASGCEDLVVNFSALVQPAAASYIWSLGDGTSSTLATPTKTYSNPGIYDISLDVVSIEGCAGSSAQTGFVEVYPLPVSSFTPDFYSVTMDDPTINFTDNSTLADSYLWNFSDYSSPHNYSDEQNPAHTFSGPGDYIIYQTVYSDQGCSDTSYTVVHVELNIAFYIPNAFSPYNQDGVNDIFRPYGIGVGLGVNTYSMRVFDRWGHQIFESKDIDDGWDGTYRGRFVAEGVYNYIIDIQFGDGLWHVYNGKISIFH